MLPEMPMHHPRNRPVCSPAWRTIVLLSAVLSAGCAQAPGPGSACELPERLGTLPDELTESSGLAASHESPGVLWSHNDSGNDAVVFAIDTTGDLLGRVRIEGARNVDWEDMELAPCRLAADRTLTAAGRETGAPMSEHDLHRTDSPRDGTDCLYIADTGDNRLRRDDPALYRVPEPRPADTVTTAAERFPVRFPDGPRDVEALFIHPEAGIHLVSKGREHPVTLYRYPPPLRADETVELEHVQELSDGPARLPRQITGAAASRDGRWIAIRSYTAVQFYSLRADGSLAPALPDPGIDLMRLAEPQGEAVELLPDGTLYLSSETGPADVPAPLSRLSCSGLIRP